MNTDEHRSSAEVGNLEHGISNLVVGEVPETGVSSQISASVVIRVHLWHPILV